MQSHSITSQVASGGSFFLNKIINHLTFIVQAKPSTRIALVVSTFQNLLSQLLVSCCIGCLGFCCMANFVTLSDMSSVS